MPARNGGNGEGGHTRALKSMDTCIIGCRKQFPGASAVTGSISEAANGRWEEMAGKRRRQSQSTQLDGYMYKRLQRPIFR